MSPSREKLEGKQIEKWEVISYCSIRSKYFCRCTCGNTSYVGASKLKGNTKAGQSKGCKVCAGKQVVDTDMLNKRFGRLVVQKKGDRKIHYKKDGSVRSTEINWLCDCDCGTKNYPVPTNKLRSGHTNSCGKCGYAAEQASKALTTHGLTKGNNATSEYKMFCRAKERAKQRKTPFNIEIDDIKIPKNCPVFGWPLIIGEGKIHDQSPSLDCVDPAKGYVKGNIWVISAKANTMKGNATFDEIEVFYKAMKKLFTSE